MKLNRIFLLLSFIIIGCSSSNEDIAKKNIEEHLLKQMNDAKSYEFVEMDSLKIYSKWDSLDNEILIKDKEILDEMQNQLALNTILDASRSLLNMGVGNKEGIIQTERDIELSKAKEAKLKSGKNEILANLKDSSLKKETSEFRTNFKFRGKNAFGAIILNSAYVRLDKDFKVKSLTINK